MSAYWRFAPTDKRRGRVTQHNSSQFRNTPFFVHYKVTKPRAFGLFPVCPTLRDVSLAPFRCFRVRVEITISETSEEVTPSPLAKQCCRAEDLSRRSQTSKADIGVAPMYLPISGLRALGILLQTLDMMPGHSMEALAKRRLYARLLDRSLKGFPACSLPVWKTTSGRIL